MSGSNISISSGNVYIKQNNGVIQSSLNNSTYSDISWPLTIQRSGLGTDVITVYIVNDLTITEVNKNKYNEISSALYNKLSIQWIISGTNDNIYENKILQRIGVKEQNIKTLNNK